MAEVRVNALKRAQASVADAEQRALQDGMRLMDGIGLEKHHVSLGKKSDNIFLLHLMGVAMVFNSEGNKLNVPHKKA